jgi:amidase
MAYQHFKAYLDRIAEVNGKLSVVAEINPDAMDIAIALDAERSSGNLRG